MKNRPTILFLCVHNAGRSQMAAAFARALAGDRVEVLTGGSEPAEKVHATVLAAMAERGIDLSRERPRRFSEADLARADVIVTMGCGESCPVVPGKRYVDWNLPDPAGESLDRVREIRDEIERRVRVLLEEVLSAS